MAQNKSITFDIEVVIKKRIEVPYEAYENLDEMWQTEGVIDSGAVEKFETSQIEEDPYLIWDWIDGADLKVKVESVDE